MTCKTTTIIFTVFIFIHEMLTKYIFQHTFDTCTCACPEYTLLAKYRNKSVKKSNHFKSAIQKSILKNTPHVVHTGK